MPWKDAEKRRRAVSAWKARNKSRVKKTWKKYYKMRHKVLNAQRKLRYDKAQSTLAVAKASRAFRKQCKEIIRKQCKVGVSLSGGADSVGVAIGLADAARTTRTRKARAKTQKKKKKGRSGARKGLSAKVFLYHLAPRGFPNADTIKARALAKTLGTKLHIVRPAASTVAQAAEKSIKSNAATSETVPKPTAIQNSAVAVLLAEAAKRRHQVGAMTDGHGESNLHPPHRGQKYTSYKQERIQALQEVNEHHHQHDKVVKDVAKVKLIHPMKHRGTTLAPPASSETKSRNAHAQIALASPLATSRHIKQPDAPSTTM